jgi:TPR repeat protein
MKPIVIIFSFFLAQLAWAEADKLFQEARALIGRDNPEAFKLMQRAAEEGSADAQGGLGYFYAQGIEVPKDEVKAADYFKKGAEGGSARSQLNYAAVLLAGQGVKKDPALALQWLEKAANAGMPEAQERLGLALYHGDLIEGAAKNMERATKLLEMSANAGLPASQNAMGMIHGDAGNDVASEEWLRKAAAQKDRKGLSNLGQLLFHSCKPNDRTRRVEGLRYLLEAEGMGEVTARNALAEFSLAIKPDEMEEAREKMVHEAVLGAIQTGQNKPSDAGTD